jgi:diguanylate cyclase (GGDEF)-like protein
VISATVGVASLAASGLSMDSEIVSTWRTWWFGDMAGDLIVAPVLLVLATQIRVEPRHRLPLDAVALFALLVAVDLVTFRTGEGITYVIFAVQFLIAFRYRQPGAVVAGLITSMVAVGFTSQGQGPFVGGSPDAELLRAQLFVGAVTIAGLLTAALVTERRTAERELREQADHDPLTGLLNRRSFNRELAKWVAHTERYGDRGALLVIDIDRFKRVNDLLGHPKGDELLAAIGRLIRDRLRETDVVARWGGDEFAVLLPRAGTDGALVVANAILEHVRAMPDPPGGLPVTVSIGVCGFGDTGLDAHRIFTRGDFAMYQAKHAGRDRVHVSDPPRPRGLRGLSGGAGSPDARHGGLSAS